jgi:glycerol kinase
MSAVVGIDQGTTGTKAMVLRADGSSRTIEAIEHRQIRPRSGWVEHDPEELCGSVLTMAYRADDVVALGIANQGETVVAWHADTKEPLYNAIVWQDVRTRVEVERLKAEGAEALTLDRAGLPLDPYFSASKLRWLIDHAPGAADLLARNKLRLGTTDSFFLDRLCGVFATDVTTASRTSLMNLRTLGWDDDLCGLFGVPREALAPIRSTTGAWGTMSSRGRDLAVVASVVDQQAALFGHGTRGEGSCKITFGTGAFCLSVTGSHIVSDAASGLLPTVAWSLGPGNDVYALDGGVYHAASAVRWLKQLGLFTAYDELDGYEGPSAIERGLAFVPALTGLGCPYWDRSAAGMWLGIGLDTSKRDLCRAVLEGIALRASEVVRAMERLAGARTELSIDGGMSHNEYFCQFLADCLGRDVRVAADADLTALGTAQLALIGSGMIAGVGALPPGPPHRRVAHAKSGSPTAIHDRFGEAVRRARGWR